MSQTDLLPIIAVGKQDSHLTQDPEITFFRCQQQQHTKFAFSKSQHNFQGVSTPSNNLTVHVPRSGDLISKATLKISLPALDAGMYVNNVGHYMIERAQLKIGTQTIAEISGDYLHINEELTGKEGRREGALIGKMSEADRTAAATAAQTLYVDLPFYCFQELCNALPLVALQFHKVSITVDFRTSGLTEGGATAPSASAMSVNMIFEHILLGDEERSKFAQSSMSTLYKQVQKITSTVPSSASEHSVDIQMPFNHPVSHLMFACNDGSSAGFNYQAIVSAQVKLNNGNALGQENGDEVPASYFKKEQLDRAHRISSEDLYLISFAHSPFGNKPSGSLNFSRIDNATLRLRLAAHSGLDIVIYAINWNVLNIASGMGAPQFSS